MHKGWQGIPLQRVTSRICCIQTLALGTYNGWMSSGKSGQRTSSRTTAVQVYRVFEADLRQLAISNRDYSRAIAGS